MPGCRATLPGPEQPAGPFHIASLSVRTSPPNIRAVLDAVGGIPGAEIHVVTEDGRMVITVEADSEAQILATTTAIGDFAGVISLALAFHQIQSLQEMPRTVRSDNEPS